MCVSALIVSMGTPLILPLTAILGLILGERESILAYVGMALILLAVVAKSVMSMSFGKQLERKDSQLRLAGRDLIDDHQPDDEFEQEEEEEDEKRNVDSPVFTPSKIRESQKRMSKIDDAFS
eukprot:GDKJ01018925.1.p1 GENE.GDKJ01018925.1~~GDKJ01018925.1.p1  ORF type:complete len:122 (+),score=39.62 GDKJ01018925.1:1-366(+)